VEIVVRRAEFVTSATAPSGYPALGYPEVAFAGRSNVGKSSLINCLLGRKDLVKTSATPGKTRLLNFFAVERKLCFVDLPGYGYAQVSAAERKKWRPMVETYLRERATLQGVVLLIDVRRLPGDEDVQLARYLERLRVPHVPVLTKVDKLSQSELAKQRKALDAAWGEGAREFLYFSAKTGRGRDDLWRVVLGWAGLETL
jgi:GTP-binding protein